MPPHGDVGVAFAEARDVDEIAVVICVDELGEAATVRWRGPMVIVQTDVSETEARVLFACVEEAGELYGGVFDYCPASV